MTTFMDGPRIFVPSARGHCRPPPVPLIAPMTTCYQQPFKSYNGGFPPQPVLHPGQKTVLAEASSDSGNSTGVCMASSQEEINNARPACEPMNSNYKYNNNNNNNNNTVMPYLHILSDVVGPRSDITYSNKIFVGGLPEDVYKGSLTGNAFRNFFRQLGNVYIEWPPRFQKKKMHNPTRYLHVIYDDDAPIKTLLSMCLRDAGGRYFLRFNIPFPPVSTWINVRPFIVGDDVFTTLKDGSLADRHNYTVVIRNVPRHYTARNLAYFAEQHFGPVLSVQITVDNCHYPSGGAFLTFGTHIAYVRAVYLKYFEVLDYFRTWDVNVEPYVRFDRQCEVCGNANSTHFCKNVSCLTYWCKNCYEKTHPEPHVGSDEHELVTHLDGTLNNSNAASSEEDKNAASNEENSEYPPLPPRN